MTSLSKKHSWSKNCEEDRRDVLLSRHLALTKSNTSFLENNISIVFAESHYFCCFDSIKGRSKSLHDFLKMGITIFRLKLRSQKGGKQSLEN